MDLIKKEAMEIGHMHNKSTPSDSSKSSPVAKESVMIIRIVGMGGSDVFELVNSRYLEVNVHWDSIFPTSVHLLWNLRTLVLNCWRDHVAPVQIWELHQLRHLVVNSSELTLPDPPSGHNDIVIMENLQTLKGVSNLYLNEECLSKLENLRCITGSMFVARWKWFRFPHSLKKLYIQGSPNMELENILQKVGSLPLLEKFVIRYGYFSTRKWETIEGQFPSLKFLQLRCCDGLEDWIVSDNSHFPVLEKLCLFVIKQLKKIPSEMGEIATLKSIELRFCNESAVKSAKKIVEEQEDLYGDQIDLHVQATVYAHEEALGSLASVNFEVIVED
ncbi:putative late blight resistance protein homolog R1B-23 isoform X2 [Salvia hispanica]|uniref:putative late blight resistance protein homolog R1B-23 isoform X2 n=1 Tax=Salvia hispanica TaxID=49212 RepID=UPI002009D074|nr:putative late blight resistance protein homolog R1B-23 isoform X2 [Salvia hispanica]